MRRRTSLTSGGAVSHAPCAVRRHPLADPRGSSGPAQGPRAGSAPSAPIQRQAVIAANPELRALAKRADYSAAVATALCGRSATEPYASLAAEAGMAVLGVASSGRQAEMMAETAAQVWERLYTERAQRWSGRPNQRLVEVASDLAPGRAPRSGQRRRGRCRMADRAGLDGDHRRPLPYRPGPAGHARRGRRRRRPHRRDPHGHRHGVAGRARGRVRPGVGLVLPEHHRLSPHDDPASGGRRHRPGRDVARRGPSRSTAGSRNHDVVVSNVEETVSELAPASGDWSPVRVHPCSGRPDGQPLELVDNVVGRQCRRDATGMARRPDDEGYVSVGMASRTHATAIP